MVFAIHGHESATGVKKFFSGKKNDIGEKPESIKEKSTGNRGKIRVFIFHILNLTFKSTQYNNSSSVLFLYMLMYTYT